LHFYNKTMRQIIIIVFVLLCGYNAEAQIRYVDTSAKTITDDSIRNGAERTELYFPVLKGKNVAIVANQTSKIGKVSLVDSLLNAGITIKKIFCPEHGFRGKTEAGKNISNSVDSITGLPIVSLYGKHYKPKNADLKGIDIVVYDIQDVGVRFYTYISTMTYVMEACAENNIEFLILDRPNPNGYYIDGPVLEKEFTSFAGLHPVPIVYGLTAAEYACMVNGEGWLKNGVKCNLRYITVDDYNHSYMYILPIPPSPNLPNMDAVYLYPSLGLFEGTKISVGRGTEKPFQVIGSPFIKNKKFSFTPQSVAGCANPPYKGEKCYGYDLTNFSEIYVKSLRQIYIYWLQATYKEMNDSLNFFNNYFNNLAGNAVLKEQIISGKSEEEIRESWKSGLDAYKAIRKKYILYPDFE